MPYKFKVGDTVKVVKAVKPAAESAREDLGKVGIVREVSKKPWPYGVGFGRGQRSGIFDVRELEAAPAKKTRKKRGA